MNYLVFVLFSLFAFQSCSSSEDDSPKDDAKEYIRIEFSSGLHAGTLINGTIGVSITEQLRAVDSYSTNLLLAADKTSFEDFQVIINHASESTGTYELSENADPIGGTSNAIVLGGVDINSTSSTLISINGILDITEYGSFYKGKYKGEFKDQNDDLHEIEGTFNIEI